MALRESYVWKAAGKCVCYVGYCCDWNSSRQNNNKKFNSNANDDNNDNNNFNNNNVLGSAFCLMLLGNEYVLQINYVVI